jgi:hypothetical protein
VGSAGLFFVGLLVAWSEIRQVPIRSHRLIEFSCDFGARRTFWFNMRHVLQPQASLSLPTTPNAAHRWSVVRRSPAARGELLPGLLWSWRFPPYSFMRAHGLDPAEASRLTSGLFATLLRADADRVGPQVSLRAWLFRHTCEHLSDRNCDGPHRAPSSDWTREERRWQTDQAGRQATPEECFLRAWSVSLLLRVLWTLRRSYELKGQRKLFETFRPVLTGEDPTPDFAVFAEILGMPESGVRIAIRRFEERYRQAFRYEVGRTVSSVDKIGPELRVLMLSLL